MAQAFGITRMRLERIGDERDKTNEKIQDLLALAEDEQRSLNEHEKEQVTAYRTKVGEYEDEIMALATDLERANDSKDISKLVRSEESGDEGTDSGRRFATPRSNSPVVYRTFAEFAWDSMVVRYPQIASRAADGRNVDQFVEKAQERLMRAPEHTLTDDIPGLLPPQHMADIMDIIDGARPVVSSARNVPLGEGS